MKNIAGGALLLALLACSNNGQEDGDHTVHWGYDGDGGPANWADLDPEFAMCRDGTEQSPIDLTGAVALESRIERQLGETVLTATQRATVMDIVNNGHTIQVTNDIPMTVEIDATQYELVQYHFHAPSEHTIDGEHAPLEAHFVHKSAAGNLAVLGILVEEGAHDPMWEPILSQLPDGPGEERHLENLDLDMNELRPLPRRYYRYRGSLTTPPCSEGVQWIVMAEKRQISPEQMSTLVPHLHNNNRPVQSLGDRTLGLVDDDQSGN